LGIVSTAEALEMARKGDLDLVEVAPNERPPVCRIMDHGKFKYQQRKRQQKQAKQHHTQIKEIRVRPKTGQHDIEVKVRRARDFLNHRDKVLINVLFRGREMAHVDVGQSIVEAIIQQLEDVAKVEKPPRMEGRRMSAILAPKG
jgi:translation initiation factor IF-3